MQALEGIKILDLSRLAPGPFASMMLGDMGADVLLIEPPAEGKMAGIGLGRGADAERMQAYDSLRRNKPKEAVEVLENGVTSTEVDLFAPLVKAWERTAKGKDDGVEMLSKLPSTSPLAPIADEQKAAMLFALDKPDHPIRK